MLLSSCPRCHDSIRIPAFAKEMSVIRCPRCTEEFPLSEIFSTLPPEAEIISGPGSDVTVAAPAGLAETAEYNLAGEPDSPKPDFQIKDSGPLASSPPMAKIDSSRPTRKPKKSEPNVFLEFTKIIVGGAAGLAIAVLMIMWFGHQDVFKIVPKLPPQAYFLVPDELRTSEMRALAADGTTPEELIGDPDVPVESIPAEETPQEGEPDNGTSDPDNQVSRNAPAEDPDESPLAAAFQQRVNASKEPQPKQKPKNNSQPKPEGRRMNAEMPIDEPIAAEEPPMETKEPTEEPAEPAAEPMEPVAQSPAKEPPAEPTEPTPIDPMLVEMVTEVSEELGPIGAEIPAVEQPSEADVISEESVDLSPVDDGDN